MAKDTDISVGLFTCGVDNRNLVAITINGKVNGISPALARHIAVDLMIWAERVEDEISPVTDQPVTE